MPYKIFYKEKKKETIDNVSLDFPFLSANFLIFCILGTQEEE